MDATPAVAPKDPLFDMDKTPTTAEQVPKTNRDESAKDPLFDLEPEPTLKQRLADDPLFKLDPPSEEVWSSAKDVLFDLGDDRIEEETKK